jgi:Tol biopolymer transport system component
MLNRTQFLGTIVLFVLLLFSSSFVTHAAPGRVETPIPRLHRDATHFTLPELPTDQPGTRPEALIVPPSSESPDWDIYPYSLFVFQSARDNNWEIYYARETYSETSQKRLTNHSASDILPRLSRDCTRIVFSSNRDGNYELYSMKTDGSDLQRLTWNSSDDVYPIWSPDGKKIAFQTYRDGQAEVYLMNPDGSNPQRLTYNADYDGQPNWSPDGKRIAFTSYRNGGYRIWVMNPDGSSLAQLNSQPYSGDPTWSSDGKLIAFDADEDLNGWLDLWIMNSDGSNPANMGRMDSSVPTDLMPRGWSQNSNYLSFTRVGYVYYNSNWYWSSAMINAYDVIHHNSAFNISPHDSDWYADWQSLDWGVPVSYPRELPAYSLARGFDVSWVGYDPGVAGIYKYDVQLKSDDSDWLDWISTAEDSAWFLPGGFEDTLSFRLRATDNAFNVEPWKPVQIVHTRLYQWDILGYVRDSRGYPVVNPQAVHNPPALNEGEPGSDNGLVHSYLRDTPATLTISKPGYAKLPVLSLGSGIAHSSWWGLPPSDDALENGNFETGRLTGWSAAPAHSAEVLTGMPISGAAKAGLGENLTIDRQVAWTTPTYETKIASVRDQTGALNIFWADAAAIPGDQTPEVADIFTSQQSPSGDWSAPQIFNPQHTGKSSLPAAARGPDGSLHLAWVDTLGGTPTAVIRYAVRSPAGSWSEPVIAAETNYVNSYLFMGVNPDGTVQIAWCEWGQSGYIYKSPGAPWSAKVILEQTSDHEDFAISPDGQLHRLYFGEWNGSSALLHATVLPGSGWSQAEFVAHALAWELALESIEDGTLVAAWSYGSALHTTEKLPGAGWKSPLVLRELESGGIPIVMAANASEVMLIYVNHSNTPNPTTSALVRQADGAWTPDELLNLKCSNWTLTFFASDQADFLCNQVHEGETDLIYTPISQITQPVRRLTQSVNLPANLHEPTLAFGYRTEGDPDAGQFDLLIDGTNVFSTTQITSAWTQFSLDLSPWAGQTIELAFQASRPDPNLLYNLFLDDISVGSWLTPVIERAEPPIVAPGQVTTVTLHGQNFITTPQVWIGEFQAANVARLDAQTLSFDLPAGLAQGLYRLRIVNPGGQTGVQVNGIQIGGWQALPLVKRR